MENEAFTVHSGPGNEGVFLRDDSKEDDQRGREVKQRDCLRSGGGNYNTDPRQIQTVQHSGQKIVHTHVHTSPPQPL